MVAVAGSGLGHLRHQYLDVTQDDNHEFSAAREFSVGSMRGNAQGITADFDNSSGMAAVAAKELANANHSFIADQRDFCRNARSSYIRQRHYGIKRKIDVVYRFAGFSQHFAC